MTQIANATGLFESLKETKKKVAINGVTHYLVEGDLLLNENRLFAYAVRQVAASSGQPADLLLEKEGLVVLTDQENRLVRWRRGLVLTYSIRRQHFSDSEYATVVDAMRSACADWEATCNVRFQHRSDLDEQAANHGALFDVARFDSQGEFIAVAFFPDQPPAERRIYIDPIFFSPTLWYNPVGVLRHELGHVLGFRHEHIRSGAPAVCPQETDGLTFDMTPYDPQSVMHYFCGGVGTQEMAITATDRLGAWALYGPPEHLIKYAE